MLPKTSQTIHIQEDIYIDCLVSKSVFFSVIKVDKY